VSAAPDISPDGLTVDEQRAWRAFLSAHARTTLALDRVLHQATGVRLGEFEVLAHLAEEGGRMRMHLLAERCAMSPSGLTRRFDALAARGWVERRTCPEDGRGVVAHLTPLGQDAVDEAGPVHAAALRRCFLDPVEPTDLRVLGEALGAIAEGVALVEPGPDGPAARD